MMSRNLSAMPMTMIFSSPALSAMSKSWAMVWLTLEINTIMFLLVVSTETKKEKMLVFFIFQSISSTIIMSFLLFPSLPFIENKEVKIVTIALVLAILLKLGMFPFQAWLMKTIKKMSWFNLTLMSTWQKVIPIIMVLKANIKMSTKSVMVSSMVALSLMIMKKTQMKSILIMSSLIHNSWMLFTMKSLKMVCWSYLWSYSLIVWALNNSMEKLNSSSLSVKESNKNNKLSMSVTLFSLGGIPPSTMFFMKMMVMVCFIKTMWSDKASIAITMVGAMSMFVYMKMFLKSMTTSSSNSCNQTQNKKPMKEKSVWTMLMLPVLVVL